MSPIILWLLWWWRWRWISLLHPRATNSRAKAEAMWVPDSLHWTSFGFSFARIVVFRLFSVQQSALMLFSYSAVQFARELVRPGNSLCPCQARAEVTFASQRSPCLRTLIMIIIMIMIILITVMMIIITMFITITLIIITANKASAGDICITEEPLSKNSAKTWKTHRPLQLFQVGNSKWEEEKKTSSQVFMKNFVGD